MHNDYEDYGESLFRYDSVGCPNYVTTPPRYNSKKLYAINLSTTNKGKEIIVIEPLVKRLYEDYVNYGFDAQGCPYILYFRKLLEEAMEQEMSINEYLDYEDSKVRNDICKFEGHLKILDRLNDIYHLGKFKNELDNNMNDDGTMKSEVLYASTQEQSEQFFRIYNFYSFYECMLYDIISFLYIKISRLRHYWYAAHKKRNLMEDWEECERFMRDTTPFTDWREWYEFLKEQYGKVFHKEIEDSAED